MNTQRSLAERFHALHIRGEPLVLFNAWDPGSARVIEQAGAQAIATGSWSVAVAFGFEDGEQLPLELVIGNARRIVAAVGLPVSIDFEGGYAEKPAALEQNLSRLLDTGIVGINFEDRVVAGTGLYGLADQAGRIAALRRAADKAGVALFINARTDLFLAAPAAEHPGLHGQALERARAYAEAGASGFFVPGLCDEAGIARLANEGPLPLNVMQLPKLPPAERLAELDVARISHGPGPYRLAMAALKEAAQHAFSTP
jgi:2-methylisocitrate lyase-like PEP mutase family enzyme